MKARLTLPFVSLPWLILVAGVLFTASASAQWTNYLVVQQTFGAQDSRYPRINNHGEFVYQRQVGGQWQIFSSRRGQLTFADNIWSDATSPAIADNGDFLCHRHQGGLGYVVRYPGATWIEFSIHNPQGGNRDAGMNASMSSDGKAIWYYSFVSFISGDSRRRLFTSGRGEVIGPDFQGDYPDINAAGEFVFSQNGQIYHSSRGAIISGSFPHIGDAPADNPDIVYVSGTELRSTVTGVIGPGSWVDVNRSGVIVFEYRTNNNYQIFKGYPLPRIVSKGGTNAVVGLRYKYDSDNKAEAYGYSENDDPFGNGPIQWSVLPGPGTPPEFRIDAASGEITWEPTQPGTNRITIAAENFFGISTQLLVITISKPEFEVVDAIAYAPTGVMLADPNQYYAGGI